MNQTYSYQLALLLASLSEKLSKCDLVKKLFVQHEDFDPYSFFRLLNNQSTKTLTTSEILNFCKENDIKCTNLEANLLIKWWDSDSDGVVNFTDFLTSIIPDSMSIYDITSSSSSTTNLPSYSTKYSFIRMLQRELNLLKELEINRNTLKVRYPFNHQDAFEKLSKGLTITPEVIFEFITEQRISIIMADILLLVNTFSPQRLGELSYLEFCEILESGIKNEDKWNLSYSNWSSPKISPRVTKSTKGSPFKDHTFKQLSPRAATDGFQYKKKEFEEELLSVLMYQIALDKELNELQKELSLMFDFTIAGAFRLFDENCNGFITTWDLEKSMRIFGINPTSEEVFLIFRRYDRDCDGKLNFPEFSEFICTKDKNYLDLINSRDEKLFSQETIEIQTKVLMAHLHIESSAESLRIEYSKRNDLYKAFSLLDSEQDGYISASELKKFFKGKNVGNKEIALLINRYDKNQDNLISYAEFIQELTPQSPNYT